MFVNIPLTFEAATIGYVHVPVHRMLILTIANMEEQRQFEVILFVIVVGEKSQSDLISGFK